MGMELAKKRAGEKTDVKMSESQLADFARKPVKHMRYIHGSAK